MSRTRKSACAWISILTLTAVFSLWLIAGDQVREMWRVSRFQADLRNRPDALDLGCLMVMTLNDPDLSNTDEVWSTDSRMPKDLRDLGRSTLQMDHAEGRAWLLLGGGPTNFGYMVERSGSSRKAVYRLYYWEDHTDAREDLGAIHATNQANKSADTTTASPQMICEP